MTATRICTRSRSRSRSRSCMTSNGLGLATHKGSFSRPSPSWSDSIANRSKIPRVFISMISLLAICATQQVAAYTATPLSSSFVGSSLSRSLLPFRNSYHHDRSSSTTTTTLLTMGLQIKIRMVGREKSGSHDQWIQEACQMYTTRLQTANVEIQTEWHKTDAALVKSVIGGDLSGSGAGAGAGGNAGGAVVVVLDPRGKMPTSEDFAQDLYDWLEEGGSRLVFCIGGAEGLPPELKSGYVQVPSGSSKGKSKSTKQVQLPLLSLSKLTFTHQFARLLLVEQIYRASEIRRGSNYHK